MKEQILGHGIDHLSDHQLLEVMLYSAIPRRDTNELAHRMINECGGLLTDVLEAGYEKLAGIDGAGHNTAFVITLMRLVAERYWQEVYSCRGGVILDNEENLFRYFEARFLGRNEEEIRAVAVDSSMRLVREEKVGTGDLGISSVSARKLFAFATGCNSFDIFIAHNHPGGSFYPSPEDVVNTIEIVKVLRSLGINVIDHVIVSRGGCYSLRASMHAKNIWKDEGTGNGF